MARSLDELLERNEPGIRLIEQWIAVAENRVEVLAWSEARENVLHELQVTTRSTLGAIAYETGGFLIEDGWLRFLGSGHTRLPRNLAEWNRSRGNGLFLVADDAVGGFFALNGGALGDKLQSVYYWAPDRLDWQDLNVGFTDFFQWSLSARFAQFYDGLRWPTWREDAAQLPGDRCFSFYPFLWTKEGSIARSDRRSVPVAEAFDLKLDIVRQLREQSA